MRKLIVPAFISLDGIVQAPGDPNEDTSGDFAYGGWIWPYADESDEVMGGVFAQPFELLLGRRTYDIFSGYWPDVQLDAPHRGLADLFNGTTKHIATHHPDTLAWLYSHALGSNIVAAVRELKNNDGPNLVTQGSSDLVRQLLATDLVDELRLLVFPILLGHGKRLFDDSTQAAAFRLIASKVSPTGRIVNHYVREGGVRTGSFK